MDVPGVPTSATATMTVTDITTGIPSSLYPSGTCVINGRVLCQVLSNSIFVTLHDAAASPTFTDFTFYAGDFFVAEPAEKLRMSRNGSSACVKFQVFQ